MVELLIATIELLLGLAVGFAGARIGGRFLPCAAALGMVICTGLVVYAATSTNSCPAGEDCEPTTLANYVWVGIGLVGFWLLAVAMGYAVSDRFPPRPPR